MFRKHAGVAVGVVVIGALWAGPARAEQFVAIDETWVHGIDTPDSHFRKQPIAGTPTDWTSPIDYSQGTAWVYLEVHTKPTAQETKFQVCFEATPTYACTAQSPTYTTVGTLEWSTPFAEFWSPPNEYVDWTLGVNKLACILKDTMNGKPSPDNVGEETAALYMPTEVRMVVTIVSPGGVYVPPMPTGEDTTGGDDSTGSSGDGDTGSTGAAPGETGGDSTGAPDPTTTGSTGPAPAGTSSDGGDEPVTTGGGETMTPPGTSSGAAGTTTGAPAADSDSGCGCRSEQRGGPGWLGLLLGLGLLRRRRG